MPRTGARGWQQSQGQLVGLMMLTVLVISIHRRSNLLPSQRSALDAGVRAWLPWLSRAGCVCLQEAAEPSTAIPHAVANSKPNTYVGLGLARGLDDLFANA